MENLITQDGQLNKVTSCQIANFESQIKELKKQEDELKAAIIEEMQNKGIVKIETDELIISYVDSFDKEKFDNKKLKEDYPNLYDQYVSMSTVKPSIRIKVK